MDTMRNLSRSKDVTNRFLSKNQVGFPFGITKNDNVLRILASCFMKMFTSHLLLESRADYAGEGCMALQKKCVVFENDTLFTNFEAICGDIHDITFGRLIPDCRKESQLSIIKNRVKNGALDLFIQNLEASTFFSNDTFI